MKLFFKFNFFILSFFIFFILSLSILSIFIYLFINYKNYIIYFIKILSICYIILTLVWILIFYCFKNIFEDYNKSNDFYNKSNEIFLILKNKIQNNEIIYPKDVAFDILNLNKFKFSYKKFIAFILSFSITAFFVYYILFYYIIIWITIFYISLIYNFYTLYVFKIIKKKYVIDMNFYMNYDNWFLHIFDIILFFISIQPNIYSFLVIYYFLNNNKKNKLNFKKIFFKFIFSKTFGFPFWILQIFLNLFFMSEEVLDTVKWNEKFKIAWINIFLYNIKIKIPFYVSYKFDSLFRFLKNKRIITNNGMIYTNSKARFHFSCFMTQRFHLNERKGMKTIFKQQEKVLRLKNVPKDHRAVLLEKDEEFLFLNNKKYVSKKNIDEVINKSEKNIKTIEELSKEFCSEKNNLINKAKKVSNESIDDKNFKSTLKTRIEISTILTTQPEIRTVLISEESKESDSGYITEADRYLNEFRSDIKKTDKEVIKLIKDMDKETTEKNLPLMLFKQKMKIKTDLFGANQYGIKLINSAKSIESDYLKSFFINNKIYNPYQYYFFKDIEDYHMALYYKNIEKELINVQDLNGNILGKTGLNALIENGLIEKNILESVKYYNNLIKDLEDYMFNCYQKDYELKYKKNFVDFDKQQLKNFIESYRNGLDEVYEIIPELTYNPHKRIEFYDLSLLNKDIKIDNLISQKMKEKWNKKPFDPNEPHSIVIYNTLDEH